VAFAPLVLPAGASVALRTAESPREFVLSFQASGQKLRADVEGAVSVGVAGSLPKVIKFTSPKPIMLRTGSASQSLVLLSPSRDGVSALLNVFSKLDSPAHRYPYLRFERNLTASPARLRAKMESLSPFL
jgi:hypothetical protein